MKIETKGNEVLVSNIPELNAVNALDFRDRIRSAMPCNLECIMIDMTQTRFVDSSGLGALFGLYKTARDEHKGATIRILNPSPSIQQLFELTQIHLLLHIEPRVGAQRVA